MALWVKGIDDKYKQFENEWRRSMDDSNEILFYRQQYTFYTVSFMSG